MRLCNHIRLTLIHWSMAHVPMLEKSLYCQTKQLDKERRLVVSNPKETVCVAVFQKDYIDMTTEIVKMQLNITIYLKSAKQQLNIAIKNLYLIPCNQFYL